MINNTQLKTFLLNSEAKDLKGLAKIKTVYRPYICPFDDILNSLPNNLSLFDVGCGSGSFLSIINEFKSPSKLAGVEISNDLVENAKSLFKSKNIQTDIYKYDGTNIPEQLNEYDYVSMIDVFHHIPPAVQDAFMLQLFQKMKSNSTLIFKDIDKSSIFVLFNKLHDLLLSSEIGNEISVNSASDLLKKAGFTIESVSTRQMLVYPHYTIIAKKL
jgi:2-polyprenyl-3-methyl-5-hydroxy-6-metoxy-1,4-benzoquinol methylase